MEPYFTIIGLTTLREHNPTECIKGLGFSLEY